MTAKLSALLDDLLETRRFIAAGEAKSFDEASYMARVEDGLRDDIESLFQQYTLSREEATHIREEGYNGICEGTEDGNGSVCQICVSIANKLSSMATPGGTDGR